MSEGDERTVVGVVNPSPEVTDAIEAGGADPRTGTDAVSPSVDAVVAVGEPGLLGLVTGDRVPSVPVLPVDAGPGTRSVDSDALASAVERLVAGEGETLSVPVLRVTVGDQSTRALADVTLVTAEPARISEYAVRTGETLVSQFRADGVVVATPLGSHGYARRVDAPVVAHGTGVVAVAPLSPFRKSADRWVLDDGDLTLGVERDEAAVELLADDRTAGAVEPTTPVSISRADTLAILTVPESDAPFGDR